ncbi:OLC1v1008050C1 [Oldenlandia corymbosa var. corymbosa]|uniref:OLC1v1008050C1 n=1 Tax=Oldenlandia corymbosa var. corymbosa TaxID=529605 RepID=A0AAV1DKP8_OLDCO|nr:OLC1v1008050C1 [Oldenlandia corymbosa var. corymbosa]
MESGNQSNNKVHILAIPYPSQGHINPMLQFCKRLISKSKGLKATLAVTNFIAKTNKPKSETVQIVSISDGFDEGGFLQAESIESYLKHLQESGTRTLIELIKGYQNSGNPIHSIVYDSFLPWVLDVAKEFGLVSAAFFTQPCAVNFVYYYVHHGLLKLPVSSFPLSMPGLPPLDRFDLPSFIAFEGSYPAYFELVKQQFLNADQADFVLVNTFYELEIEVVRWLEDQYPIKTIGPSTPSMYVDKRIEDDKGYAINLFKQNRDDILRWLDSKEINSVVYISFGSLANLGKDQMEEIGRGLVSSNCNFLWVVRSTEVDKVPNELISEAEDRGLIVNWCPQLEVLAHEAVGCFVTHCGWNSTMEALSLGVPMVTMPVWVDQTTNSKFIVDVWQTGIRLKACESDGIVTKEEVEIVIKEVMLGEKSSELRNNALKWKELAKEAINEGGSSDKHIEEFVYDLMIFYKNGHRLWIVTISCCGYQHWQQIPVVRLRLESGELRSRDEAVEQRDFAHKVNRDFFVVFFLDENRGYGSFSSSQINGSPSITIVSLWTNARDCWTGFNNEVKVLSSLCKVSPGVYLEGFSTVQTNVVLVHRGRTGLLSTIIPIILLIEGPQYREHHTSDGHKVGEPRVLPRVDTPKLKPIDSNLVDKANFVNATIKQESTKIIYLSRETQKSVENSQSRVKVEETKMASKPHVLVLILPVQGHINPLLQFSKILASKGIKITVVITNPIETTTSLAGNQSELIKFECIPAERIKEEAQVAEKQLAHHQDSNEAKIETLKARVLEYLPLILEGKASSGEPVKVVVYDSLMPYVSDVAKEVGISGAAFFTQSAVVSAIYYHLHEGAVELPLKKEQIKASLPSVPYVFKPKDLPSFVNDSAGTYSSVLRCVLDQSLSFHKADWVLINTLESLELQTVRWMVSHFPKFKTIGPTIPTMYLHNRMEDDRDSGISLFKPEIEACKQWLDTKSNGTVVYVSFGSMVNLSEEEMTEIAWGLVKSKCHFLWVIRASEESKLPTNFASEVGEKGLIVNWCSQLEVLDHDAVGCFLTHCGWNSTLEALSLGVPMVVMPRSGDQPTNAKLIVDVWQTGLRLEAGEDGIVRR